MRGSTSLKTQRCGNRGKVWGIICWMASSMLSSQIFIPTSLYHSYPSLRAHFIFFNFQEAKFIVDLYVVYSSRAKNEFGHFNPLLHSCQVPIIQIQKQIDPSFPRLDHRISTSLTRNYSQRQEQFSTAAKVHRCGEVFPSIHQP